MEGKHRRTGQHGVVVKQASMEDLSAIMRLEQHWSEEGRADEAKLIARLKKFPQGFFIGYQEDAWRPVAMITACPIRYHQDDLSRFKNWCTATNDGFLDQHLTAKEPLQNEENALYIVSGIIDPEFRGGDLFSRFVNRIVQAADTLKLCYVVAGSVLPGFKKYCETYGTKNACEYVFKRRGDRLVDPLLAKYESLGFHVINANHVIPDYFPDTSSLNYAALVVKTL